MTFVAIIIAAVIVGVVAQSWKGRTGAGWGLLTIVIALPWWLVVSISLRYGAITGQLGAFDETELDVARVLLVAGAVGGLMLLIVATLPTRRAIGNTGTTATDSESQGVVAGPTGDTMPCPRCAETIKRAAHVCRFCGHELIKTAS